MNTTKSYKDGKENQETFLNKYLPPNSGIGWHFDGRLNINELLTRLDVFIFDLKDPEKCIRVRCFVKGKEGQYVSPLYNLSPDMSVANESDDLIKSRVFKFFTETDLYFLTIRKKGLSVSFWLDKYINYPPEAYTLQSRYGARKDRIVLNYTDLNLRKFDYIENLPKKLKSAINENSNIKTS